MNRMPELNLPPIRLRARRDAAGRTLIFDELRRQWVVLTPEEWVRRHVAAYMVDRCGFPPQALVEEYPVDINGTAQRADIVAFGSDGRPLAGGTLQRHSRMPPHSHDQRHRDPLLAAGIGVIRAGADVSPIRINRPHSAAT